MSDKKNFEQFNVVKQCQKYGFPLWQCPQFLFLVMGVIIIFSTVITYAVGTHYIEDPLSVAFIVLLVAIILLIISAIITRSFERLTEANRMKSEFVSIVSHQLRSPLSNLKWVTELLMSGRIAPVSEKQAEYFRILKENSDKMKELISDLLIVSRIEEGKFLLNKEKVSLVDLIQKTIKETEIFIKASNIKMDFKPADNLPEINIDSSQVKLAISNLLDNAVHYTKEKGKVEIELKRKNNCLYFEIKDNGAGIPKEDQKYIFQKFFRSSNAKKQQTEGSGLGLYIAKSIIEKSGGKIGFKSQEGIGSTFWFMLPIK